MKLLMVVAVAVPMLGACASRQAAPPPPPPPPPPIVQVLVSPPPAAAPSAPSTPVAAPVVPAPITGAAPMIVPVMPPPPPALQAGEAFVTQPTPMRARPIGSGIIEQNIPAGASLRLEVRQVTRDGAWWFVKYQGQTGWVSERGLSQE